MNILERIKKRLGIISPEKLAEGIETSFNKRKENGEEHPIDDTVEEIMNIIKENPDLDVVRGLLINVLERQNIPNRVFEKASMKISEIDEIPDKVITQVVEQTKVEVPSELINTIIEEGKIDSKERLKLIQNVEDKEIKENRVKYELKILYNDCKDKRDGEVAERINEIKAILENNEISKEIQNLIYQVVAKKMAENCHSEFKGTKIYDLSKVMSTEEMIENNLPKRVLIEYKKIQEKDGEKERLGLFSEENLETNLRKQILNQMAREIVNVYKETNILAIPQSNNMKLLTTDEEEMFIRTIRNFSEKLSDEEISDIKAQIKGKVSNTQVKENMFISKIKKIPDERKSKYIDMLSAITENGETLETLKLMMDSGLMEKLNSMPEEKRKRRIETIGAVLEKREQKIATQTIKMPGNPQVDIYIGHDSDQR